MPTSGAAGSGGGVINPATLAISGNAYAWVTPSGNIFCLLQAGSVFCQARSHTFDYQGEHCGSSGADGVEIDPGFLVKVGCYGDAPQNQVRTLAYGSTVTVGSLSCDSEQSGMKCLDAAHGDGFVINKSSITLLPNGDHPLARTDGSDDGSGSGPAVSSSAGAGTTSGFVVPAAFLGTWTGHGRELTIKADGRISISYRIYTWCGAGVPAPCDAQNGNLIIAGGSLTATLHSAAGAQLSGTVTSSTSADHPKGSTFALKLSGGVISTALDDFCDPAAASTGACGA